MEVGDMAAWAALAIAVASFGWQVANQLAAQRATRLASLSAEAIRADDGLVLVRLSSREPGRHTEYLVTLRLVSPKTAKLVLATVTDLRDPERLQRFGEADRDLTLDLQAEGDRLTCRFFVVGLDEPFDPFMLDVELWNAATHSVVLRRRRWAMRGRRH